MRLPTSLRSQVTVILLIFQINEIYSTGKLYTADSHSQYYIEKAQMYTWYDGLSECLKRNMSLVSIETKSKSEEIKKLVLNTLDAKPLLWIDGIMTQNEGKRQYIWTKTGQDFNYTFWSPKNPDFKLDNEYCIHIDSFANMTWNDNSCEKKFGFICENQQHNNELMQLHFQEMVKKVLEIQQKLEDPDELKEKLKAVEELNLNLQQQLDLLKVEEQNLKDQQQQTDEDTAKQQQTVKENLENELKEIESLQQKHHELQKLLEEIKEIELNSKNLEQSLQTQTEAKEHLSEALQKLQKVNYEYQTNEKLTKTFRDIIFYLNQNTYNLTKAQITLNGINSYLP